MDDQAILRAIEHWQRTGDERTLDECLGWLARGLRPPPGVVRMLGAGAVEDLRWEVLGDLLGGRPPLLLSARRPRDFARAAFRNRLWDALRQHQRKASTQQPGLSDSLAEQTHAAPSPDLEDRLEQAAQFQRILDALRGLRLEERVALLLLTAPDQLPDEDWEALVRQHPPPPPKRPLEILEREEISRLLFPLQEGAYERTTKLIQRLHPKLRRALGLPAELPEDP